MFFIKTLPLMMYWMIHKGKPVGHANAFVYTISLMGWFVIIHIIQLLILINYSISDPDNYPISKHDNWGGYYAFFFLGAYILLHFLLAKLYKKRLGRWYLEDRKKRIMKFSTLIVWSYFFLNIAISLGMVVLFSSRQGFSCYG